MAIPFTAQLLKVSLGLQEQGVVCILFTVIRKANSSGGVDGAEGVWEIRAAEKLSIWSLQVREIHLDFLLPSPKL